MAQDVYARHRSRSANKSHSSRGSHGGGYATRPTPPTTHPDIVFEACTATASFFLYAQRNIISCLHHDTLAIERRFDKHREDVLLMEADNVSDRGAGRLMASYDAGQMAIVWDLFTGNEIARFSSYEHIRVAAWMKDGSVAFGNDQGNIILFEPPTSEHISARTIFDPVTALAPLSDCRTFAIGYQNGSILIATLQPSFTILHTLTTSSAPSPITGLAWHGSSSKSKSDMLATQTSVGDLRIWSVPKSGQSEAPRIIRVLSADDVPGNEKTWFSWSKNGRILQHRRGETLSWDVRTKNMNSVAVPVVDNMCAIANYGPGATLFTVASDYTVQQYDLNAATGPIMVANVQHIPPNAPPTPPDSVEDHKFGLQTMPRSAPDPPPKYASSADGDTTDEEAPPVLSPIQKIAKEMDDLEAERRDQLAPLSPVSSRASLSSASSYGRQRRYRRAPSSRASSDRTKFSLGESENDAGGRESISIQSSSSQRSQRDAGQDRQRMMRDPRESQSSKDLDLFSRTKARLADVKFRTPQYPNTTLTPDILRREMLSVVFGWDHDIESLIRDEQTNSRPGSTAAVLLSRWLGDLNADSMAQMIGSESMSSSDWMLLALSSNMGGIGAQKQVSEVFVRRLLETGEIHPAVAILLGLGEQHEAVEVYVSRQYYLEAVLLTCLVLPNDWQRQSFLVRKWGETAVKGGQAELAVRCFSCTTIEPTENWFSPRAQDAVYQAQQQMLAPDSAGAPASPPSAGPSNKLKQASLKLITSFGDNGAAKPRPAVGVTPIVETATTPVSKDGWTRSTSRNFRDDSRTRTATPGGVHRSRLPSTGPASRQIDVENTPLPETAIEVGPAGPSLFAQRRAASRAGRSTSNEDNGSHLRVEADDTAELMSPGGASSTSQRSRTRRSRSTQPKRDDSPSRASVTSRGSFRTRNIDRYIDSLEDANNRAHQQRAESRTRGESRDGRSRSRPRPRELSEVRSTADAKYIAPAKRSPSSPKALSTEDAGKYLSGASYDRSSPVGSVHSAAFSSSRRVAPSEYAASVDGRGRSNTKPVDPGNRSPSSPSPMRADAGRTRSQSARPTASTPRARSVSRRPRAESDAVEHFVLDPAEITATDFAANDEESRHPRMLTRKELAQKELEQRRLSLARRPSAPAIPQPNETAPRPSMSPRSFTDGDFLPSRAYNDVIERSQTVDPEAMGRYAKKTGAVSSSSVPIGLPATPRAMRHPRYTNSDPDNVDSIPAVPAVPSNAETLAPICYNPREREDDDLGPLLPMTVYNNKGPITRSATAPPEKAMGGLPARPNSRTTTAASRPESMSSRANTNHSRRTSASEAHQSSRSGTGHIEIVHDAHQSSSQVIIIEDENPPVLSELQHLNNPPPPPPPPIFPTQQAPFGVVEVGMEHQKQAANDVGMIPVMPLTAANLQRRSQTVEPQGSAAATQSKWRQYADRMRSTSKSRTKSPSMEQVNRHASPAPYETYLPSARFERTKSPGMASDITGSEVSSSQPHPTPSATPLSGYDFERQRSASTTGYRNPKEIRANMPPSQLQPGVGGMEGGMI